jgi:hypothetical protein
MSNIINKEVKELKNYRNIEVVLTAETLAHEIANYVVEFYKGNDTISKEELLKKINDLRNNVEENWSTPGEIREQNEKKYPDAFQGFDTSNYDHELSKNILQKLENIQKEGE